MNRFNRLATIRRTEGFTLRTFEPNPDPLTLEGHLLKLATQIASGVDYLKPESVEAFFLLMKQENEGFVKDNPVDPASHVSIFLDRDIDNQPSLVLKGPGRHWPTARINAKSFID